jgi:hypothetical protein
MAIAGNILGEATPPAGNSFNEATRGRRTREQEGANWFATLAEGQAPPDSRRQIVADSILPYNPLFQFSGEEIGVDKGGLRLG